MAMKSVAPESKFAFGGVEVMYENEDGKVVTKVLSPPTQVIDLNLPTVNEVATLRADFGEFVTTLMKKEKDPEYLTAFENYQEVQDYYQDKVCPAIIDMLLRDYGEDDQDIIFTHIQSSQLILLYRIVARIFNVNAVLKMLHDTEGALPKNS